MKRTSSSPGRYYKKLPSAEEVRERAGVQAVEIRALLLSSAGKQLLAHLNERYNGSLVARVEARGMDVNQTLVNIGAREVVEYLNSFTKEA
jgi:hypothetical protein